MLVFVQNIGQKYDFQEGVVVSNLSSFSPNCQKITWGCHGGIIHPHDAPMLFFDNLVKKLDKLPL